MKHFASLQTVYLGLPTPFLPFMHPPGQRVKNTRLCQKASQSLVRSLLGVSICQHSANRLIDQDFVSQLLIFLEFCVQLKHLHKVLEKIQSDSHSKANVLNVHTRVRKSCFPKLVDSLAVVVHGCISLIVVWLR